MLNILTVTTWLSSLAIILMIQPLSGGVSWEISTTNLSMSNSMFFIAIALNIISCIILATHFKQLIKSNLPYKILFILLSILNLSTIGFTIIRGGPSDTFANGPFDVYRVQNFWYQVIMAFVTLVFIIMIISLIKKPNYKQQ